MHLMNYVLELLHDDEEDSIDSDIITKKPKLERSSCTLR